MKFFNLIIAFGLLITFTSCNGNERQVRKIFKRINAGEINSASKYVWPEDHAKLFVFHKRFLENNPLTTFEFIKSETSEKDGKKQLIADFKVLNGSSKLLAYFDSLKILNKDIIQISFEEKKANETTYLDFPFDWDDTQMPKELELGVIKTEQINLRGGADINSPVITTAMENDQLLIDPHFKNEKWRRGYLIAEDKPIQECYFSSKLSETQTISFFTLGYFEKISFLALIIVGIIVWFVMYPILFFGGVFGTMESPPIALSILALLLGSVYFTYQLIESLIFELFLYNLPY
jgi:hypothetical protein